MAFVKSASSWALAGCLVLGFCLACFVGLELGGLLWDGGAESHHQSIHQWSLGILVFVWTAFLGVFATAFFRAARHAQDHDFPRQRLAWYDNAKFLVLGFVVLVHFMVPVRSRGAHQEKEMYDATAGAGMLDGNQFYYVTEVFGMSLMAFISGTGCEAENKRLHNRLHGAARNLWLLNLLFMINMMPPIVFNLVDYLPDSLTGALFGLEMDFPAQVLPIHHLWYLWNLVVWSLIAPIWFRLRYPVLTALCMVFLTQPRCYVMSAMRFYSMIWYFFFFVLGADLRRRRLERVLLEVARKSHVRVLAALSLLALIIALPLLTKLQWAYSNLTPVDIIAAEMTPWSPSWRTANIEQKGSDMVNTDVEQRVGIVFHDAPEGMSPPALRGGRFHQSDSSRMSHLIGTDAAFAPFPVHLGQSLLNATQNAEAKHLDDQKQSIRAVTLAKVGNITWMKLQLNWLVLRVLMIVGCFSALCVIPSDVQSWSRFGARTLGSYVFHPVFVDLLQNQHLWQIVLGEKKITAGGVWLLFCISWIVTILLSTELFAKLTQLLMWPVDRVLLYQQKNSELIQPDIKDPRASSGPSLHL